MKDETTKGISSRFTYLITFLLGLAFSITLVQSAWKTTLERKQNDFQFEILSIKQSVARNVLTGNDVINNVGAFMSANDSVVRSQFTSFANDMLNRNSHLDAVNYYQFVGDENQNAFELAFTQSRGAGDTFFDMDIYSQPKFRDAIDTAITSGAVVPAPPDVANDPDRKYWLFKAVYLKTPSSIQQENYDGVVKGIVSVLVSPIKMIGDKAKNSSLTITMFSDTVNLYGRQLLYLNEASNKPEKRFIIDTFIEEELIHLPPYSIKIIIEKDIYFSDIEYHIIFIALLISIGILMLLHGLAKAKTEQENALRERNREIERKVEEQTSELAVARDKALEAVRLKSEFLASMSHEIRTPLNAIIGMSDLLAETKVNDEQRRYVDVFRKAGDALLTLVNDILDLSKIEAGQLVLEHIPFNLQELIEEVADIYALKAADKNIEIITYIDSHVNCHRVGDPGRIKQIILNLISNAIKFTDNGQIIVSLTSSENQSSNDAVTIRVKDTGIGIAAEKLSSIFSSFTQADASTTRKYGGTGLGLTISQQLSNKMQGQISVESREGEGSQFDVVLTLEQQSVTESNQFDFANKSIVIVDPTEAHARSIEETLKFIGVTQLKMIYSLDDDAKALTEENVDLVIIDGNIYFDNQHKLKDLPSHIMLLLSPKQAKQHIEMASSSRADSYVIKPIKRKDLLNNIEMLFSNKDDVCSHGEQTSSQDVIEVDARHILLVEDNPDNRMLIKAYLKKTAHTLDEAENGQIALEKFKNNHYDLVFMDVQMPVMDGHQATREIRAWETQQEKPKTRIIALTAHAIKEEIDKCLDAGCDTHLSKPVKKATLIQTIESPL